MMKKKKIMIIEDDEEFLKELEELLVLSEYTVDVFSDGDRGLEMARVTVPDVVLLDLKLAGKSGFQTAAEFSRYPETRNIPIIAMSGFYNKSQFDLLNKQYGLKAFLEKPVKPLDIISEIEKIT